ncbi:uncharacterized protein LOC141685389 [Apium graveolens]|uniref:uncharacterized protein LOC141685389 n=1 Tax=Apium graveolens TaxID=4045 RepID=UPI003D7A7BB1
MDTSNSQQGNASTGEKRKRGRPKKIDVTGSSNTSVNGTISGQYAPQPFVNTLLPVYNSLKPTPYNHHFTIPVTPNNMASILNRGRPRKVSANTTLDKENHFPGNNTRETSILTSPPQKRPVGRPQKITENPIFKSPLRPLLPILPSTMTSYKPNSTIQTPSTSQMGFDHGQFSTLERGHSGNECSSTRRPILDMPIGSGNSGAQNTNNENTESFSRSKNPVVNLLSSFDDASELASCNDVQDISNEILKIYEDDFIGIDNDDVSEDEMDDDSEMTTARGGPPQYKCKSCHSIMWIEERNNKSASAKSEPTFSICCAAGQIELPKAKQPPAYLAQLLFGGPEQKHFHDRIKVYNCMFAYSSLGGKVDRFVNVHGGGPFCYRQGGQNHHSMGTLKPVEGGNPRFCQLYFHDTENEVNNRINAIQSNNDKDSARPEIVQNLIRMFDDVSPLAKKIRQARDRFQEEEQPELMIVLKESRSVSGRINHISPTPDVAALIVVDEDPNCGERDVILHLKQGGFVRISFIHPLSMALQYPILFPFAEDGFHKGIKYRRTPENTNKKRECVTLKDYYSYQYHIRPTEGMTLRYGRRLYQQYIVDAFSIIEQSPNPKWPEIQEMFDYTPGLTANDAPDVVARVFKLKLDQLLHVIKKKKFFGRCIGALHVIEFQKRGLPHAHMVIWLHPDSKPKTIQQVDRMVSAEISDKQQDPHGYDAVKQFMKHGPCGESHKLSPCIDSDRKNCTRHFPKRYCTETSFDDSGFPVYRRRKTNHIVRKNDVELDNRWVVPYNRDLLVMFQCHINIEICNHARSLKYLFKYCMKGHDRATMLLVKAKKNTTTYVDQSSSEPVKAAPIDEISQYLDGRYVCAAEAVWRTYGFSIHHRTPSAERLPVHLEDMQTITFKGNESLENVENCALFRKSKLQAWFEANKKYPWGRNLSYQEFPAKFVWDGRGCQWTPRKQGLVVGRLHSTYASSGDLFYLRMILTRFKGATSFADLRTVNGEVFSTFKDACNVLGLLENDNEWHRAITENSHHATASQLRQLFVHILVNCQVELEKIFNSIGKSLRSYPDMPLPPSQFFSGFSNTLIVEERSYDIEAVKEEHQNLHSNLNADQAIVYDAIIDSVYNKKGHVFFVYGSGGCGKTFLWRTIIARLRSERKIVLPVAGSGIAAVLLPGGRTAHSRFKIPLDIDEQSSCGLKNGTDIAELLQNTDLIIWDEAPI